MPVSVGHTHLVHGVPQPAHNQRPRGSLVRPMPLPTSCLPSQFAYPHSYQVDVCWSRISAPQTHIVMPTHAWRAAHALSPGVSGVWRAGRSPRPAAQAPGDRTRAGSRLSPALQRQWQTPAMAISLLSSTVLLNHLLPLWHVVARAGYQGASEPRLTAFLCISNFC